MIVTVITLNICPLPPRWLFPDFKQHLRVVTKDAAKLLASFHEAPDFDLWSNPVTQRAATMEALSPSRSRSQTTQDIFKNCNAQHLSDDGCDLIDGGINGHRRLWLIYKFHSLTDYRGRHNYTEIVALISFVIIDHRKSNFFFGFDWKHEETLSRLIFDADDATLGRTVFPDDAWHSTHHISAPTIA